MTAAELLTEETLAQRLAALRDEEHSEADAAAHAAAVSSYRYVRPLTDAADSLIEYLQNTDGRVMLGLTEVDMLTRGFGPGELVYLVGFSHSGKTQLALTMVCNNRDRRFVLFTADEPAELVLTKLCCMRTGSNAERLEERVKNGDNEAIARVRRIAREDFKNLIIVDQSMSAKQMSDAISEAEDYWSAPVDAALIDYLELFARAEGVDVEQGSQHLKAWAMSHTFPTICIHQGSRGNSGGGQVLGMNAGKYGGEQEAIVLLGVRRQRDNDDLDALE